MVASTYGGWVRNPAPVENGGKHPIFHIGFQHVSTIQGDAGFLLPSTVSQDEMAKI